MRFCHGHLTSSPLFPTLTRRYGRKIGRVTPLSSVAAHRRLATRSLVLLTKRLTRLITRPERRQYKRDKQHKRVSYLRKSEQTTETDELADKANISLNASALFVCGTSPA